MNKVNSISLMVMGIGFLILALLLDNVYVKSVVLLASIVLNVIAIFRNFKEKKENKF